MNLTKRNTKGEALTWDDIDNNWTSIEEAINAQGSDRLYEFDNISLSNSCSTTGVNTISISGTIKILKDIDFLPIVKGCIVLNGNIVVCGASTDMFIGAEFPFVNGSSTPEKVLYQLELPINSYPAKVSLHLWDDRNNFSEPYTYSMSENPCSYIHEVAYYINASEYPYDRKLLVEAKVKGSGEYKIQYFDNNVWHQLALLSDMNTQINLTTPLSNSFPATTYLIRIVDANTEFKSIEQSVLFSFHDWYTWHNEVHVQCNNGQELHLTYNMARMPASNVIIEYLNGLEWNIIASEEYLSPINMIVVGGGIIHTNIPPGVYDIRIRNTVTGKTLVAEGIEFPDCSVEEVPDIEVISAEVQCDSSTGYFRKLAGNVVISAGSGDYKFQYFDGVDWQDLHTFSHTTGSVEYDFYVSNTIPSSSYNIRVIDIADENTSNILNVSLNYSDTYTWLVAPNAGCHESIQKLQLSISYINLPESDLVIEVYVAGVWQEISNAQITTPQASGIEEFNSPIDMPTELNGTYNLRVRNSVTGASLLMPNVSFSSCGI